MLAKPKNEQKKEEIKLQISDEEIKFLYEQRFGKQTNPN
jgi:hypothetical protein